jgi:hypothetical protein
MLLRATTFDAVRHYMPGCEKPNGHEQNLAICSSHSTFPQLIIILFKMVLLTSSLIGEAFDFATTPSGAAAIGVGAVSLYLLYTFYLVVSDPLRKIPGPFWARYTRLWEIYHVRQGNFHYLNVELHKKYGKLLQYLYSSFSIMVQVC